MNDVVYLDRAVHAKADDAFSFLLQMYKDKIPILLNEGSSFFLYSIVWPPTPAFYRDPALESNLRRYFSLTAGSIPHYFKMESWGNGVQYIESFQHCWALRLWSEWITARRLSGTSIDPLIIHIDSHDDLQRPAVFLGARRGEYTSLFQDERLDLFEPPSVNRSIERGLVGIGGFIRIFLHALDDFKLLHVFNSFDAQANEHFEERRLALFAEEEIFAGVSRMSPGIGFVRDTGQANYIITNDLARIARHGGRKILLDIDMDYFNNEFDNNRSAAQSNPEMGEMRVRVDELVEHLTTGMIAEIEAVSIALSPNFFPSTQWDLFFYLKSKLRALF